MYPGTLTDRKSLGQTLPTINETKATKCLDPPAFAATWSGSHGEQLPPPKFAGGGRHSHLVRLLDHSQEVMTTPSDDEHLRLATQASAPRTATGRSEKPPSTGLSRKSASTPNLRSAHGSVARSSHRSRLSQRSLASIRSKVSEVVEKEVRTTLGDYYDLKQADAKRARDKFMAMPIHLRPGASPTDQGYLPNLTSATHRALKLPVSMAVDPKWSTELKKMNDRIGVRIRYENKLAAAITGSMAPELPDMWMKEYLSNPPTPYFVAGRKPHRHDM
eukprot:TRINITY_DN7117_c0_g1_i2.p1 TRINITY_DN7117_c0_g1~~TRINITY_DN7117_c0_g1_i2.p1  ORF type:complete len:275 (+),score=35.90 TRINITY_DN7117_c0_g1_i2:73-897(+)